MTEPVKPFRIDLASWLVAEGRAGEADTIYRDSCGKEAHASLFRDVRDRPDLFPDRPFVCATCASDLERQELVAYEAALRAHLAAQGQLDDETLNTLRARRDQFLRASDWTQLTDNRDRLGPDVAAAWDAARMAARTWFSTARDTGQIGVFPGAPDDPPSTHNT